MNKVIKQRKFFDEFEKIFNYTRSILYMFGLDVLREDYTVCWRTFIVFTILHVSIAFCAYGAYADVVREGDLQSLLKSGAVIGMGIQGSVKAIAALIHQHNFRYIYAQIKEMYELCETKSERYREVLKDNLSVVKRLLVTILSFVTLVSNLMVGVSAYELLVLKIRTEFVPFHIPFLNEETDSGYYTMSSLHILCTYMGLYGNFVCDTWLFVYVSHIPLMKNILKCKFDDLNVILKASPRDTTKSAEPLFDIFKWHQKYNKFCSTISEVFFWIIFVQVFCEFFGIVCTIIVIFLGLWPPAPVFGLYLIAMIYSYCFMGNLVEMANEDIITMIYDFNWYELTVREQKMIMIMLREAQNANGLSLGGVAPLTMNLALQLTKTIYTFSMMLKEFLSSK